MCASVFDYELMGLCGNCVCNMCLFMNLFVWVDVCVFINIVRLCESVCMCVYEHLCCVCIKVCLCTFVFVCLSVNELV